MMRKQIIFGCVFIIVLFVVILVVILSHSDSTSFSEYVDQTEDSDISVSDYEIYHEEYHENNRDMFDSKTIAEEISVQHSNTQPDVEYVTLEYFDSSYNVDTSEDLDLNGLMDDFSGADYIDDGRKLFLALEQMYGESIYNKYICRSYEIAGIKYPEGNRYVIDVDSDTIFMLILDDTVYVKKLN